MSLEDAVRAVVERNGGVRAAERATGVDKSFISRLMNGRKVAPSAETLQALGLRAVPLYEVLRPNAESNGRTSDPTRTPG
jgi:transcriptional regulator with XRE-family HTH domain